MADQRRSGSSKIEAHPLVEALVPDPSQPPERTTKLFGYPGKSPEAKATRLWLDLDLSSYVDVPDDAIRYHRTLPDDAGTILWVVADASLQYGSVTSHQTQADFLSGGITTAYLGGAGPAGPGPLPPTLPPGCPLPTHYPPCASDFVPCGFTHFPPCPTHSFTCPTAGPTIFICCEPPTLPPRCPPPPSVPIQHCPTHTVVCQPSVFTLCPSQQILCATQTLACHQPSRLVHCPSVQLICTTQPVVCQHVTALTQCPTKLCPSVSIPCATTPACPPPSLGCPIGDPGVGGGIG
jgi:hypothetical protein